jgi:putative aldouronate transport system substrate-binding protein
MMLSSFTFALKKVGITKITFDKTSISLSVGETFTPSVKVTPSTASKAELRWSSSNASVAVVNYQGTISALKAGTAKITAKSSDGKVSKAISVAVTAKTKAVQISIPIFERGRPGQQPADTGYWAQWIKAKVLKDINVDLKWVPIARPNPAGTKAAFNLLIASNTAPDIITEFDAADGYMAWLGQGVLQEIDMKQVNQYAPDFVKYEGANVLKYGKIKGKQYFLPGKRPTPLDSSFITMIRQDWLDKVGLKNPKTCDELFNVLSAFKTKDPGKIGANKVIPMTLDYNGATNAATANWIYRPSNYSDLEKYMYSDVSVGALSWEPERKRLQFFNKLYNAGLVSPEFMLDTDSSKARAAFMNGYGGIWSEYIAQDAGYIDTLKKNVPTAKLSALYPYTYKPGQVSTCYYYTPPVGLMNGINKNCKHVPEVLKYLNWLSKPENLATLEFGIEGKTYKVENGKKVITNYTGKEQLVNGSNGDYYGLVTAGIDMGSAYANMKQIICAAGPQYEYLIEDTYKYLYKPYNVGVSNVFIPEVVKTQTTYASSLITKYKQYCSQLIIAKPSEFDSKYKAFSKDYLESGYQKILDEKKQVYNEWFK